MELKKVKLSRCDDQVARDLDVFYPSGQTDDHLLTPYPIIVENIDGKWALLHGFNKIKQFRNRSLKTAPAYIIAEKIFVDKLIIIINYQRSIRALYPIEIARIIELLKNKNIDKRILATKVADAMGINRGFQIVDKYEKLLEVPEYIVEFLIPKTDSLKIWQRFVGKKERIFQKLLELAPPTLSEFLEIEQNLSEIAQRQKSDIEKIAKDLSLENLLRNKKPRTAIKETRKLLKKKRYPVITKHRRNIDNYLKKIRQPGNISLQPDPTFETRTVKFETTITDQQDLRDLQDFLSKDNLATIKKLLENL
ncbi:MAG: hypothetical protein K9N00_01925 [Candidatus Marinimicrobia bacterium]|nr:hypothetical protein [Candidatus Neomarinimicrobiota bacterium]